MQDQLLFQIWLGLILYNRDRAPMAQLNEHRSVTIKVRKFIDLK